MNEKRSLQFELEKNLADKVEVILENLGLTVDDAVTAYFNQITATGGIPFPLELTEREKEARRLMKLTECLPVKTLRTKEEAEQWIMAYEEE